MTTSHTAPRAVARHQSNEPEAPIGAHPLRATPEETAALRLWVIMSRAHAAISEHAAADIARHGLTLTEFAILEALYHRGPMLLGEVQRRILVSSGGITFLVDRLVAKSLVERRACASDRRARYAALTPKGETLIAEIFPSHAATLTRASSGLPVEQQAVVTALLRTLGLHAADLPKAPDETADDEARSA
jgi:MarR family transcriptional regulator, 2-MHQ and catechol-resistance regulon repressor